MEFLVTHKSNHAIIALKTNKIDAVNSSDFKQEIEKVLSTTNKIVIDFSEVFYVDSTAIGAMLSIYRKVNEINGTLVFSGFSEMVLKIISISKLETIFSIESNIENAEKTVLS